MKKALKISLVYLGLVIGAGFASGREIFEYFNIPSQTDFTGIILASICFAGLSYIVMSLARYMEATTFDEFIFKISPRLSPIFKLFMTVFMFCGYFVMLSAGGTLFEIALSLPSGLGILAVSIFCFVVFVFDISGIVAISTILVPIMIAGMLVLCVLSSVLGMPAFSFLESMKSNSFTSVLCYVSYNTITAGAVLVPLSKTATPRNLKDSAVFSGIILGCLIFAVWFALNIYYDVLFSAEMPLLELADLYGGALKKIYALILFMSLCTTAIGHGFGILSKFSFETKADRVVVTALLCLLAMPFAKIGFSELISKLYGMFGILGLFWTGLLVFKFLNRE